MNKFTYLDCKLIHDELNERFYLRDPETGLCIWGEDPGRDPLTYTKIEQSFLDRIDEFLTAHLWVVPSNLSWSDTKYRRVKSPPTFKNRQMLAGELYHKLKQSAKEMYP